jgi:crotonobetaine/carnitine-CoA ligase
MEQYVTDQAVVAGPVTRRTGARTVVAALEEQAARFHRDPFLITPEDRVLGFGEVRDRARDLGAGLRHHGIEVGDRVAYMSANRIELVELTFGAAYAGMITVPINVFLKGEFLRHQLVNSAAAAIAVDRIGLDALLPLLDGLPDLRLVILLDPDLEAPHGVASAACAELFGTGAPLEPHQAKPLDTFLILYTSGTTGASKGCMLSHAYMARVARVMSEMLVLDDDDVQICVHPMFHMSGHMDLMLALTSGTPMGLEHRFSASGFFDRAKVLGATYWGGPGITDFLLEQPPTKDHRLRRWIGIPFAPEKQKRLEDDFGIRSVCQMYAQTEANPVATVGLNHPAARHTDGRVCEDIECAVVDDEDNPVPAGEVGEIVIRPRVPGAIFSGYWNDAERNIECWRNLWHHTGDLGKLDAEGLLTFVDRKKDAMRRKGENVSAMELERALLGYGQIAEVAAHAVRTDEGEHIKACIVLKPDETFDRRRYAEFVMENVPHFAVPRFYELLEALPRNPIGRVLKFELREAGLTAATVDLFALGLADDRRRDRRHDPSRPASGNAAAGRHQ